MVRDAVTKLLERASIKRALFIGETILDDYCYVMPLGKSPKENIIPVRFDGMESWEGGVVAAAAHARDFCQEVSVYTSDKAVSKVRYVHKESLQKLFEVHYQDDNHLEWLPELDGWDVTVVTDFGYGFLTPSLIAEVAEKSKYLCVNAQTNSSNVGFNLITKYPKADYVVIDELEARLAAADRDSPIEKVIEKLAKGRCKKMVVTLGQHGAVGFCEEHGFARSAALSKHPVDTMGAGDAFFAVSSLIAEDAGIEDILLIGNAAGALKTKIIGHRRPVTKKALLELLQ